MATARPRTLSSAGFIAQLIAMKKASRAVQEQLLAIGQRILAESVARTPLFDPEMHAGWKLIEQGALGGAKYNVTVVNTSPRATQPLEYEGTVYSRDGEPYTLLDIYNHGISTPFVIAPGVTANALAFFWQKAGRQWRPREGQEVTHPGLPAYKTIDEPRRIGKELTDQLRATARGAFRAAFRGRARVF